MADLGRWAIALAGLVSVYTVVALLLGVRRNEPAWQESGRHGAELSAVAATVAVLILLSFLVRRDFSVRYVADHVDTRLPLVYTVSALWAGQEGSLLLWLWLLTCFGLILMAQRRLLGKPLASYALAVVGVTQAFLAAILVLTSNPFALSRMVPAQGQGLNPLLQNMWMVIHPPVVFAGYAAYTIPFALALGGLAAGKLDRGWLGVVRRWALLAWMLLGAGIIMGAWWAYQELGWGGYWGWDPVENSSLLPWLTGTALLHSLMVQERRGASAMWNLWLIVLTFALCYFATFITRSGFIESVHAFSRSNLGYYFLAFIAFCFVALLFLRERYRGELPGSEGTSLLSRETGILTTNLLFLGAALIVLVGTLFPSLAEIVLGRPGSLDTSFYERSVGPLAQIIVLLIGICPWLAWGGISADHLRRDLLLPALAALGAALVLVLAGVRQSLAAVAFAVCALSAASLLQLYGRDLLARRAAPTAAPRAFGEFLAHRRRRYGGHLVHLGIVLIAAGIAGSSLYQSEVQVALAPGESVSTQGYTITYQDLIQSETPSSRRLAAQLDVARGSAPARTLWPRQEFFFSTQQWVTEVAIRSTALEDFYVILAGVENDGLASFRVLVNPLVLWLWVGGVLLLVGGAIAGWPDRRAREGA